jgi:hypothetical protein
VRWRYAEVLETDRRIHVIVVRVYREGVASARRSERKRAPMTPRHSRRRRLTSMTERRNRSTALAGTLEPPYSPVETDTAITAAGVLLLQANIVRPDDRL